MAGMLLIQFQIPGTPDFSDVFFTNDNTGWITSSASNNIYKTVDGAATFSTQTTPLGSTNAIHMLDGNNGYSGGEGGWVYNTSDGGLNWNILASMGNLLDISFPFKPDTNNPIGYACGDAGRVWEITSTLTNLNSPSASDLVESVHLLSIMYGYVAVTVYIIIMALNLLLRQPQQEPLMIYTL